MMAMNKIIHYQVALTEKDMNQLNIHYLLTGVVSSDGGSK